MEYDYKNFLEYVRLLSKKGNLIISDVGEKYIVHQPHDKLIKIVLEQKKEMVGLINKVLKLKKKLKEEEIEKYDNKYINYMFENREADIVYKMKEREIYFLVEHQTKVDYNMPQRILEYETAIITKAIKGRKMTKENHKIPRVIPIVIYTGRKKWNVEKYIEESQEKIEGEVKLGQYYVVDINEYTKEELEKDKLFLSKVMLMEKAKTEDEIIEVLSRAIEKEEKTEMIKLIKKIIIYIFEQKISKEEKEKLIKRIENKEARSMVFEVIKKENERLVKKGRAEGKRQGISEGIKQGIKQGTENIVIQMLKIGLNKDIICKVTNITKKEIEQIKINNENKEINNI